MDSIILIAPKCRLLPYKSSIPSIRLKTIRLDKKGLRLLIKPNGAKYWRMKYRFAGKQKTLTLGVYPEVSLKDARIERDQARLQINKGIDPSREKQIQAGGRREKQGEAGGSGGEQGEAREKKESANKSVQNRPINRSKIDQ